MAFQLAAAPSWTEWRRLSTSDREGIVRDLRKLLKARERDGGDGTPPHKERHL